MELLGKSRRTIFRMARRGEVVKVTIKHRTYFTLSSISNHKPRIGPQIALPPEDPNLKELQRKELERRHPEIYI